MIGAAVMVARIATGEIEGAKGRTPNRAKGDKFGGARRGRYALVSSKTADAFPNCASNSRPREQRRLTHS